MYMLYIIYIYIYITFNSSSYVSSLKSSIENVESSGSFVSPAHISSSKPDVISVEKLHYSAHGNIYISANIFPITH